MWWLIVVCYLISLEVKVLRSLLNASECVEMGLFKSRFNSFLLMSYYDHAFFKF